MTTHGPADRGRALVEKSSVAEGLSPISRSKLPDVRGELHLIPSHLARNREMRGGYVEATSAQVPLPLKESRLRPKRCRSSPSSSRSATFRHRRVPPVDRKPAKAVLIGSEDSPSSPSQRRHRASRGTVP